MPNLGSTSARDEWVEHRNYPDQVLLLGSHDNFRRISRYLVAAAEVGDDITGIGSLYLRWIAGMRSHEAYEEHKLYPYLEHRWAVSFAPAQAGHELLHRCHERVVAALTSAGEAHGDVQTDALAAALRSHDATLHEHLELEEHMVIPRLLELSPREFRRYTMTSIESLLGTSARRS